MTTRFTSRFKLLAIVAIYVIPFLIAWIIYTDSSEHDLGSVNRGELITPAYRIDYANLISYDGTPLSRDVLTRRWTFLFWSDGECDLYCEANLFKMRQARWMLGREASRVQMVYLLASGETFSPHFLELAKTYPKLIVSRLSDKPIATAEKTLSVHSAHKAFAQLDAGKIYILDPLANVIMAYPKDTTTRDLLKDMKHLVKASKIG